MINTDSGLKQADGSSKEFEVIEASESSIAGGESSALKSISS